MSLHVRRTDVTLEAETNPYFGIATPEYYERALNTLHERIAAATGGNAAKTASPTLRVFIFSDDIAWVQENLKIPYPTTYVSDPGIKDYEELVLMSMCPHNVIANSSFSWWGAWLNENPNKVVVAPSQWVRIRPQNYKDTVPETWIKI